MFVFPFRLFSVPRAFDTLVIRTRQMFSRICVKMLWCTFRFSESLQWCLQKYKYTGSEVKLSSHLHSPTEQRSLKAPCVVLWQLEISMDLVENFWWTIPQWEAS